MRAVTLVLALTLGACASLPLASVQAPTGDNLYAIEEISPRVHVLTQGDAFHIQPRGNVEVIEQSNGVVLVDSGGSPAGADEVIAFIRSRTPKPVTAIVLTHWHGDHTLGVSRLLEQWPAARVISTESTRDVLASPTADRYMPGDDPEANRRYQANIAGGVSYLQERSRDASLSEPMRAGYAVAAREYERFGRDVQNAHRRPPTETFSDRLTLSDRSVPVEVMFLGRANTAGDAIVWLPRQRIVITGDVVVRPIPYGFNSYPAAWVEVLQRIKAMRPAIIAPGHGEPMRDAAYLDTLIAMLTDVRTQVAAAAGDTSVTTESAGQRVDLFTYQAQFAHDDPWLAFWFNDYWRDPIASSALREARGEPIVQGAS